MTLLKQITGEVCRTLLLQALYDCTRCNELVLVDFAHAYGFERSRAFIHQQLDAMEGELLITSDLFNGLRVVEITGKGRNLLKGQPRLLEEPREAAKRTIQARVGLQALAADVERQLGRLTEIEDWLARHAAKPASDI